MAHPITQIQGFNFNALNRELDIPKDDKELFETLLQAYNGDYWQKGGGSLLPPATGVYASDLTGLMAKRFVFRNVIRECVERVSKAFFGKNPNWKFQVDGKDVEDPDAEVEKGLGEYYTKQNLSTVMAQAFESRLATGRGGIRMYVPVRYKRKAAVAPPQQTDANPDVATETEDTRIQTEFKDFVKFESVAQALEAIRVEFIDPKDSRMLDEDGELFSIVKYKIREDWENNQEMAVIEFSFVDDSNLTFIGLVPERGEGSGTSDTQVSVPGASQELPISKFIKSSGYNLDGMTTFYEMKGVPYVTNAMYRNNQLLNLALTCSGFALVEGGFGEVFLTNVEMQTETVRDPDSGEMIERPVRMIRGGGAVQNLAGVTTVNEETGQEQIGTPGVHFKDPTPLQAFKDGKELAYTACLEEAGQLYALISGDATASGESRIQAMKDFYLKIVKYKSEVDQMGGWIMTTALRWAVALAADTVFADTSVVFDSKIFIGDVTKEEREALRSQWKDGVISLETCRVLSGVDDPALEDELVIAEGDKSIEEVSLGEADRRADLANKLAGTLPTKRIRKIVFGYEDAEIAAIEKEEQAEMDAKLEQISKENEVLGGPGLPGAGGEGE